MAKIRQEVSGCMRTLQGAQDFAAIRSYTATAAKHNLTMLHVLARAIALSVRGCGGVGFEVRHAERGDGAGAHLAALIMGVSSIQIWVKDRACDAIVPPLRPSWTSLSSFPARCRSPHSRSPRATVSRCSRRWVGAPIRGTRAG